MTKKILLIATETNFTYANSNSAVAKYLNTLAESLEDAGYEVDRFPAFELKKSANYETNQKKSGLKLWVKKVVNRLFPRLYVTLILKKKIQDLELITSKIISNYSKPDLILEFLSVGSAVGARLKSHYNIPLVVIYDSPLQEQFCEMHRHIPYNVSKIDLLERESIDSSSTVIVYGQTVKDYVLTKFKTEAVAILPCIIWKTEIAFSQNKEPIIGFVGSFLVWHKVNLLVEAFEQIALEFPKAKLVLLGYGQEWNQINERVKKSIFSNRIEMPGFVTEEKLLNYKANMMIGVMPCSNWYGSPLKLFEYAQSSIAIIAPETPVVCDLFNKNEVLFIDKNNSLQSLVQNLRILLRDDVHRNRMIEKSSLKMKGAFSKAEQMKQFIELIEKNNRSWN